MKKIILIIINLFPILLTGQFRNDYMSVTDDVIEIKEINYKNNYIRSGSININEYSNGKIKKSRSFSKRKLTHESKTTYINKGNEIIKKTIYTNKNHKFIEIDSVSAVLLKRKIYINKDLTKPNITLHSFSYDSENKLKSYKMTWNSSQVTDSYEYTYTKNRIVIQEFNPNNKLTNITTYLLDNKGKVIFKTIDCNCSETVILGARSEKGVRRLFYKYDAKGNWIKRYYVSSNGKKILEVKRKIKYKSDT